LESFFQGVDSVQMNIAIRHGHVSEATQAVIREKTQKLAKLYEQGQIELTIDFEHPETPAVDLKLTALKHDFVAAGQAESLLAAVDMVVDRVEQQLRKYKEKVQDRHRSPVRREE
jgi:putative sigma-54 modulation protein